MVIQLAKVGKNISYPKTTSRQLAIGNMQLARIAGIRPSLLSANELSIVYCLLPIVYCLLIIVTASFSIGCAGFSAGEHRLN
jgi:hypothetical protein